MSSAENSNHHDHRHRRHRNDHRDPTVKVKGIDIPKGYVAIMVGNEGNEIQRFVVPVIYVNHPLFMKLLKEAEDEFGFDQKGAITIPCKVEEFRCVRDLIEMEEDHTIHKMNHGDLHHVWCFRV